MSALNDCELSVWQPNATLPFPIQAYKTKQQGEKVIGWRGESHILCRQVFSMDVDVLELRQLVKFNL